MSDLQPAEGATPGNSGFASEWQRLAREDDTGQAPAPQDSEQRHESGLEEKPAGQGGTTAPPSEAAPQRPAPGENTDDIWATAPAPLRQAYEAERVAREKAENAVRSNNGRLSKAEREAAELRARIVAQPHQQQAPQQQAPQPDPALRQKLLGEYEEVNAPVVDEVLQLRQEVARLSAGAASADAQREARDRLELAEFVAGEEQKLSEAHGDWSDVVMLPEFVQWVQTGPQFIRDGIARNGNGIVDGAEAAKILDLFKVETGRTAADDPQVAKRRRQLEGARAVPARTPGATPAGTPDDFDAEWKRLAAEDERRSATASGRR